MVNLNKIFNWLVNIFIVFRLLVISIQWLDVAHTHTHTHTNTHTEHAHCEAEGVYWGMHRCTYTPTATDNGIHHFRGLGSWRQDDVHRRLPLHTWWITVVPCTTWGRNRLSVKHDRYDQQFRLTKKAGSITYSYQTTHFYVNSIKVRKPCVTTNNVHVVAGAITIACYHEPIIKQNYDPLLQWELHCFVCVCVWCRIMMI